MGTRNPQTVKCTVGRAKVNRATREQLFADSGGFCQKPDCSNPVFSEERSTWVSIAEVAHIISASPGGPRPGRSIARRNLGDYYNLLLFCANCHRIVDKADRDYPEQDLHEWKLNHKKRIAEIFGVCICRTRSEARNALAPILLKNRVAWESFGPDSTHQSDPETEIASTWLWHVRTTIIPNNRSVLRILESNRDLLQTQEKAVLAKFAVHVKEFEARHLEKKEVFGATQFPIEMEDILK